MKRNVLRIIIVAVLMLTGCSDAVTDMQVSTSTITNEAKDISRDSNIEHVSASSNSLSQSNNPSNYVKTYKDETHKEIKYGKLLINFDDYHIVTDTLNDDEEIFKCAIDTGKVLSETNMTVSIREIKKQNFYDKESIIKYLTKISPNFEKIMIYNNVNDDSAITSLYIITGEKLSNYIVCYEDACYLLESDYRNLDSYLFKNDHEVNYEVKILEIECANSYKAHIKETITYNKDELENVEYEIIQDKEETKYIGELSIDKKYQYQFILKNDKGEKLLTLSTYGEFYDVIKFLDVNMDGYADIRFLEEPGTLNNEYILYVYDDSAKNFIKVKCDEMLSEFDVHDDYLLNYQKDNADSGVIQKLTWENKYTLVKVLEEQYNVD